MVLDCPIRIRTMWQSIRFGAAVSGQYLPPPQTAMTLSTYTNCVTIRRLMCSCVDCCYMCDVTLSCSSGMDSKGPCRQGHGTEGTVPATVTLTYLLTESLQICHNKSSNIFLFLIKTFSGGRHRYF